MKSNKIFFAVLLIITLAGNGCKKFIEATSPKDQVTAQAAFTDSSTALAALLHIYTKFGFSGGTIESYFAAYTSLYADELIPLSSNTTYTAYYNNAITPDESTNAATWQSLYSAIYESNAVIEGALASTGINNATRSQYESEAKFLRAFSYFLLINCYGDVPLVLNTDVTVTAHTPRTDEAAVYTQIINDLTDAKNGLSEEYPSGQKVRANKWAATALLAKVHLYLENWKDAEATSSEVINAGIYAPLEAPEDVFLKNSKEAILQISENYGYSWSGVLFHPSYGSLAFGLTPALLQQFNAQDLRKQQWIDSFTTAGATQYYPDKYKNSNTITANTGEYTMCLRIGEQYLVRAEARCHQDNIAGAVDDINVLRARAGIGLITMPISMDSCTTLVADERVREMFTEWGNRFFDLKRTGKIDAVLEAEKPSWKSTASLYPIPQQQISYNNLLTQNPGY